METIKFSETMLDALKKATWEKSENDDCKFVSLNPIDESLIQDLTGVYTDTLNILGFKYHWAFFYAKGNEEQEGGVYSIRAELWVEGALRYHATNNFEHDVLNLFGQTREESDWRKVLSYTLNQILQSESVEDVIENLKEEHNKLWSAIREDIIHNELWSDIRKDIIDNLEGDDLSDNFKESLAHEWINDNTSEAFDRAWDNMDSYEIKDKIIDYLSDNL